MNPAIPRLYAILDRSLISGPELDLAVRLAEAGVQLIQYRNKQASSRELFERSAALARICDARGVRFIVNDRPDIALLAHAGGVHVGQKDLDVEEARAICGASRWVGVSTHTLEQVAAADSTSADYIAFGPIFATATKQSPGAVVGTELLSRARQLTEKPLVAIGGITLTRAAEVFRAGADSLAVAQDLICARDPAARAKQFLDLPVPAAAARGG